MWCVVYRRSASTRLPQVAHSSSPSVSLFKAQLYFIESAYSIWPSNLSEPQMAGCAGRRPLATRRTPACGTSGARQLTTSIRISCQVRENALLFCNVLKMTLQNAKRPVPKTGSGRAQQPLKKDLFCAVGAQEMARLAHAAHEQELQEQGLLQLLPQH
jgi:hypothetical protein